MHYPTKESSPEEWVAFAEKVEAIVEPIGMRLCGINPRLMFSYGKYESAYMPVELGALLIDLVENQRLQRKKRTR